MNIEGVLIIFGVIIISMTLHEAVHAFVGYFLGDDTAKAQGRLTLNPLKHIDPVLTIAMPILLYIMGGPIFGGAKPVPLNPSRIRHGEWGMALVAVAGPLTNLLLAFIAFGIGVIFGVISTDGIAATLAGQIIWLFVQVNLGFFIFNMLPIPPLDGSRVLYALAPEGARRVMEQIERYGLVIVLLIVLVASPVLSTIMLGAMQGILEAFMFIFRV
ncbi:site-2 protease family protein [Candidatus Saccharibacteria bacterium]|jgi:Zn-dependent protease|nr:site-2 protease family protein [Candidatus Saccharibacteria bacterium]